ncbi:tetratricopeptide repeat protein [Candidatus Magnetaquicoccus inordinatus]|uniref:tetratricopeptide repeat protein n=1 Tax=Candidatus Magnetaquicoccus inordinatus TaxID=2496818 RepID=UPI00102BD7C9|nr:hypothetical protein [Candidatus Magnetaquicoccus inordinatus]
MTGAGLFVALLLVTLFWVLQPVFSRAGNRPLLPGLEEDPLLELSRQKERLLRQLKEWQLEGAEEAGVAEVQATLQRELAEVMLRLDRMAPMVSSETAAGEGGVSAGGKGLALLLGGVLLIVSVVLYLLMGRPPGLSAPVNGGAANPAQMDQGTLRQAVARLAQRLEQEPDNLAGWLHLARSQATLDDEEGAKRSYRHVLARQAENIEAAVGLAELLLQSGLEEQLRQGAALLEGVLRQDDKQADALWLLGALAARAGEYGRAVEYWQRLLPLLTEGSESRTTVENALREARSRLPRP